MAALNQNSMVYSLTDNKTATATQTLLVKIRNTNYPHHLILTVLI